MGAPPVGVEADDAGPVALEEGGLGRVAQSVPPSGLVGDAQPVDQQLQRVGEQLVTRQHLRYAIDSIVGEDPHVALLAEDLQLLPGRAAVGRSDGREEGKACARRVAERGLDDIAHLVLLHLHARDGRVGPSDPGEEQAQVLVDLGRGPDSRSWVAGVDLLLDGDRGRDALDVVAFRLAHPPEELPGIGRQALDIAALPLGVERVEGQRRLSASR